MMVNIVVQNSQNMFDIALRYYGSVEGVFQVASDNDLSVTDDIVPGQVLKIDSDKIVSSPTVDYINKNG